MPTPTTASKLATTNRSAEMESGVAAEALAARIVKEGNLDADKITEELEKLVVDGEKQQCLAGFQYWGGSDVKCHNHVVPGIGPRIGPRMEVNSRKFPYAVINIFDSDEEMHRLSEAIMSGITKLPYVLRRTEIGGTVNCYGEYSPRFGGQFKTDNGAPSAVNISSMPIQFATNLNETKGAAAFVLAYHKWWYDERATNPAKIKTDMNSGVKPVDFILYPKNHGLREFHDDTLEGNASFRCILRLGTKVGGLAGRLHFKPPENSSHASSELRFKHGDLIVTPGEGWGGRNAEEKQSEETRKALLSPKPRHGVFEGQIKSPTSLISADYDFYSVRFDIFGMPADTSLNALDWAVNQVQRILYNWKHYMSYTAEVNYQPNQLFPLQRHLVLLTNSPDPLNLQNQQFAKCTSFRTHAYGNMEAPLQVINVTEVMPGYVTCKDVADALLRSRQEKLLMLLNQWTIDNKRIDDNSWESLTYADIRPKLKDTTDAEDGKNIYNKFLKLLDCDDNFKSKDEKIKGMCRIVFGDPP
mmetsp:Transcript_3298/g.8194  ORF Transcript_3298/g.8194 Transcript_3298/m.8194 type:complete len:528 (-) Transcript_3298:385-1968(-)|eukprot:CAMPEP_0181361040 /NCGR_PEP_ID=MMETSP1106-20121128/7046_1 /TAXON_ID=81844 /ORGANISM="Mantoniella antarctica, Strain SL-175" /LENGTH=527 /DNA_ID=CAMNT_0023474471 /DNA_START=246 /DNA_END=1829 /DNA_ORIENTATION=-